MIEVVLNDSYIVSGLFLDQTTRKQWLQYVAVEASGDNVTFLDWGNYSASNFTEASTILFPFPVNAKIFRITVFNYIHHWLNHTRFPFSAQAIVSTREPFTCGCPMLASGECCPRQNMRVWQDQCFSCMDPYSLNVMMVDGCGICKPGTVERWGKCVAKAGLSPQGGYGFMVGTVLASFPELKNVVNDSRRWTVQMEISNTHGSVHSVFLIDEPMAMHPCGDGIASYCCLLQYYSTHVVLHPFPEEAINTSAVGLRSCAKKLSTLLPNTDHQFYQYDRGRYSLTMSSKGIRTWAQCVKSTTCTGYVGVLFAQPFSDRGRFAPHVIYHPLELQFVAPPFMISTQVPPSLKALNVNFHRYEGNVVKAQVTGVQFRFNHTTVQWDDEVSTTAVVEIDDLGYTAVLPAQTSESWRTLRLQGTTADGKPLVMSARNPSKLMQHSAVARTEATMVTANVFYGLSFNTTPAAGDSERIMTFVATSARVRRLLRLQVSYGRASSATVLATSRGVITYSDFVMDMGVACADVKMTTGGGILHWLERHTQLYGAERQFSVFIDRVCAMALDQRNRVFCMVPLIQQDLKRADVMRFEIMADFG
jgi:hypothetical protein